MRNPRLRNMILAALMAALIAAVSPYRFYLPGVPNVPVTMQVLVVFLAGGLLGPVWGALSMGIYLLLGAAGLGVFSGGSGGLSVLLGPTGGYLFSYPLAAAVIGLLAPAHRGPSLLRTGLAMLPALALIYLGGAGWAVLVGGKAMGVVMSGWVLPFIPFDLVKIGLAAAACAAVNRALVRQGFYQTA
ncbi:MAG: biotin transporter BioY [Bacillota bacterium]